MSVLISKATGNWLTSTTWGLIDSTSYVNGENATEIALSTTPVRSDAFTPGAITIDGIAIKLAERIGTTGTITVRLELDIGDTTVTGTSVTIDVADLPSCLEADLNGGWVFFKFAAPVLLIAATAYQVAALTSNNTQVEVFSSGGTAGTIDRALRTTTEQAPVAGDDVVVCGEKTGAGTGNAFVVTMNETATTDYGSNTTSAVTPAVAVCHGGTLKWADGSAANPKLRLSGHLIGYAGGTISVGASGAEIPRDSIAILEFDCATDGDFGLIARNLSTLNIAGLSRTSGKDVSWCLLNTDEAVNSTSLGVDTDTGWLDNDVIVVASTIKPGANQNEAGALNGNAGESSLTVDSFAGAGGGIAFAHLGGDSASSTQDLVMPDGGTVTCKMQAEVINLTRNAKVRGVTAGLTSFVSAGPTALVYLRWVEFSALGVNTTGKRGVECDTNTSGSLDVRYCSFHDCDYGGLWMAPATTDFYGAQIKDNVFYKMGNASSSYTIRVVTARPNRDATWVIDRNVVIEPQGRGVGLGDLSGTFTNNRVVGLITNTIYAMELTFSSVTVPVGKFDGNVIHSNTSTSSLRIIGTWSLLYFKDWRIWRETQSNSGIVFDSFGCGLCTFERFHQWGSTYTFLSIGNSGFVTKDCVLASDSGYITTAGPWFDGGTNNWRADNCHLAPSAALGGFLRPCATDIAIGVGSPFTVVGLKAILRNCAMGAGPANIAGAGVPAYEGALLTSESYISCERINGTAGNHKTWLKGGIVTIDTTIFRTASPSARMTPMSATDKAQSAPILRGFKIPVLNGVAKTPSIWVRKSVIGDGAAYNGNQPRLIVRSNPALGLATDTVLATAAGAAGSFEQLSAVLPTPTDDGAFEVYVDCDGTAGWVNIDDMSVT